MGSSLRRFVVVAVLVNCVGVVLALELASSDVAPACERNVAESAARAQVMTGSGRRVLVVGDSYSAGRGLDRPGRSWPSALTGEVHVDGFSGSGFSAGASPCDGVAFADRAAVSRGTDLVVVQGGLNDHDQPDAAIRSGVRRLLARLAAYDVVLVGPPSAPARSKSVARVDALLASEARRSGVGYISMLDVELDYLDDRLHLTAEGHRTFGAFVEGALGG